MRSPGSWPVHVLTPKDVMWKWCRTGRQGWRPSVISPIWSMCARVYPLLIGGPPGVVFGAGGAGLTVATGGTGCAGRPAALPRVVELRDSAELGDVVRARKRLVRDRDAEHRAERLPSVGGPPFHQAIGRDGCPHLGVVALVRGLHGGRVRPLRAEPAGERPAHLPDPGDLEVVGRAGERDSDGLLDAAPPLRGARALREHDRRGRIGGGELAPERARRPVDGGDVVAEEHVPVGRLSFCRGLPGGRRAGPL